jgi:hypothetical protein
MGDAAEGRGCAAQTQAQTQALSAGTASEDIPENGSSAANARRTTAALRLLASATMSQVPAKG